MVKAVAYSSCLDFTISPSSCTKLTDILFSITWMSLELALRKLESVEGLSKSFTKLSIDLRVVSISDFPKFK